MYLFFRNLETIQIIYIIIFFYFLHFILISCLLFFISHYLHQMSRLFFSSYISGSSSQIRRSTLAVLVVLFSLNYTLYCALLKKIPVVSEQLHTNIRLIIFAFYNIAFIIIYVICATESNSSCVYVQKKGLMNGSLIISCKIWFLRYILFYFSAITK